MIGFINITKYTNSDFEVNDGFDIEQIILVKRENNLQFSNLGEPVTKFVYYDSSTKEYNAIFLYSSEAKMIDQYTDYLTTSGHTDFPDPYIISKYGPLTDFDVKIRPITIPDALVTRIRTSLELGYLKFSDESSFNALDVSDVSKFDAWASSENVDSTWTSYPDASITNDKDMEYFMDETRGMALNIDSNKISQIIPQGLSFFEDDIKTAITASRTAKFSDAFFKAITDLSVTIDNSQF